MKSFIHEELNIADYYDNDFTISVNSDQIIITEGDDGETENQIAIHPDCFFEIVKFVKKRLKYHKSLEK